MFNYIGAVESKVEDSKNILSNDYIKYQVSIPTINSKRTTEAYVLTQPGIQVRYNKGDMVLVGELDTKGEYIILGVLQTNTVTTAGVVVANSIYKQNIKTGVKTELEPLPDVIKNNFDYFNNIK